MSDELYTSGHVPDRAGVPRWWLLYQLEKGAIPGPSYRVPGRRLYTEDDVARITAAIAQLRRDDCSVGPRDFHK